jgi:glutamine synthetase adenylyltransferase
MVTLDGRDVDTKSDFIRRAYEPEFSRLVTLNAQKKNLLEDLDSAHERAAEASELMNHFLTDLKLTLATPKRSLMLVISNAKLGSTVPTQSLPRRPTKAASNRPDNWQTASTIELNSWRFL